MSKQIAFIIVLAVTLSIFSFTSYRIISFFKLTKPFPVKDIWKRIQLTLKVAIGQSKIFRFPFEGILHAFVFWGFIVICIGSVEIVMDGILGKEHVFSFLGWAYSILVISGDYFAWVVGVFVIIFLIRRIFMNIKRFKGIEMKKISKIDANIALTIILLLMISLIGMNLFNSLINTDAKVNSYLLSSLLIPFVDSINVDKLHFWFEFNWWIHILLVFIFANILPYSKHFHVFMSIPNVFFSRLEPLGHMTNMDNITREVKLMMNPDAYSNEYSDAEPERFGVMDATDVTWKNYLDSLACTECGRCTSVCPANITGKLLSPRKIMIDLRARMKEKGMGILKNGVNHSDNKSLIRDYISVEELWACTTCNACAQECPININQPALILDMRRYLVMEESAAPAMLNTIFTNIENNGAPWQFSPEDRMKWSENLELKEV